ncbi:MAG: aldehyde dehydrogenase [Bacteroidetes bacterium]|nr:MAG: aldehyde dehydrogenase [Bacteroidota bacterium]
MQKSKEIIEILNDLVEIHHDRIAGYERAVKELKNEDMDLKSRFDAMILESQHMISELANEIQVLRGTVEPGTTTQGKIYRAWAGLKAVFSGDSRHTILSNCEQAEDATQKAYSQALDSDLLPAFLRQMLINQQQTLKDSHDEIHDLRDQYA